MREAPSRVVLDVLLRAGARVVAHDPIAVDETRRVLKLDFADAPALLERISFSSAKDPMEALAGADALIIVTEWKAYRSPNLERLKTLMKSPVIFDGRNLYEPAHDEGRRRRLPGHRAQQPLRRGDPGRVLRDPARKPADLAQPAMDDRAADPREHAGVLGTAALGRKGASSAPRSSTLQSALPKLELPPFVAWLEETGSPRARRWRGGCWPAARSSTCSKACSRSKAFLKKLHGDAVITPAHPQYAEWKRDRQQYEALLPAPFTARWSQDHNKDAEFKPWTWITSAFLHGGTGHLLGNMLFLFLFGFSVELALGRGLYLSFYLLGAVGASALAAWAYAGKGSYGLGASGAVSALMGMYAVMYRLRRIRFFYQLFFYFNYVTAPALILLPAWIANELLQHFVGGQGIAYMAHLGGLLTGALLMAARDALAPAAAARGGGREDAGRLRAARRRGAAPGGRDEVRTGLRRMARSRAAQARRRRHAARLVQHREALAGRRRLPSRRAPHLPAQAAGPRSRWNCSTRATRPTSTTPSRARASSPTTWHGWRRRFTRAQQFNDAERLCQALLKAAPDASGSGGHARRSAPTA